MPSEIIRYITSHRTTEIVLKRYLFTTGTSPFPIIEKQGTIYTKLVYRLDTIGYQIQNVKGNSNCTFHAYSLSARVEDNSESLKNAAYVALSAFRKTNVEDENTKKKWISWQINYRDTELGLASMI